MKSDATDNRRLKSQFFALIILAILPISMIASNGIRAFQGILTDTIGAGSDFGSSQNELEQAMAIRVVAAEGKSVPGAAKVIETTFGGRSEDNSRLKFGVYDPLGEFAHDVRLKLRHVYVSWASFDVVKLEKLLTDLENTGFEILLTVEPWPKKSGNGELLSSILAGEYDSEIDRVATVLNRLHGPV